MVVNCISYVYLWNEKNVEGKKERIKINIGDVDFFVFIWFMICSLDLFCFDFWLMVVIFNYFFRWVW